MKLWRFLIGLIFLVACTEPPPPPSNAVVRLEISPNALLFTTLGEKQQVKARAFDANGNEVNANITWTSSRPEQVSASANGELEAKVALGASQITAQVGTLTSAPVLVSVAQPVAGVILVTDAQIQSKPTLVNPNAEDDTDNEYEVLISGITPPVVGSMLLGSEGTAVGGEVISSVQEGSNLRVRLKTVAISSLMAKAQIKETIDYKDLKPVFPDALTKDYTISETDGEFIFTPKPNLGSVKAKQTRVLTKFKLGPYDCDFATPELPVSLGQPGQFSLKINPTVDLDYDSQDGLKRLVIKADTSFKMKASLVLTAGGVLNLDCQATLYTKMQPLPGWAGLILAGEVKAGIGFEIEGNLSIPLLGVEITSETKGTLEMGMDCASGECHLVKKFDPVNTNQVRFVTPSIANVRTDLFVFGYGFAKLKAGATLLEKLRMDLITARAGLKLEGSFAPASTQLTPSTNLLEPDYQSSYKLSLLAEIVAGSFNKAGDSAFRKLLLKLGVFKFNLLKFQSSKTLATSPKGKATQDKKTFSAGDTINFRVNLEPESTVFPFIKYNVQRIVMMRKVGSEPAEEITSIAANSDQTDFSIPWVADADSTSPRGKEFYAFVDTKLPVPFDLELGKASIAPPAFAGTIKINATYTENSASGASISSLVDSLVLEGSVTQTRPDLQLQLTGFTKADSNFNFNSQNTNQRTDKTCTWSQHFTNQQFSTLNTPKLNESLIGQLIDTPTGFKLEIPPNFLIGAVTSGQTQTATGSKISGVCDGVVDFTPVSSTTNSTFEGAAPQFLSLPSLTGAVTKDATGTGIISTTLSAKGSIPSGNPNTTKNLDYTVILDLKQQPVPISSVDLELSMIAPAIANPEGAITYAVNLHNKSLTTSASNIRAEFFLPEGFTVTDTQGWSGCTTIQTTVTCSLSSLATDERRAFLIDVKVPASGGVYLMSARVTAKESDPNLSDNFAVGSTIVEEPTP